jgi:NOL1/NOP2/fmu family ribosome biogenesis protein
MQKCGGEECDCKLLTPIFKDKKLSILYKQFEEQYLHTSFYNLHLIGTNLYSLPNGMPQVNVQMLRAGVHLGEFVKDRFEPSHSLAMCLKADQATCIEVDEQTALSYLAGITFDCDQKIKGWALVTYNNFPIGWCKAVNGTAKNHLPKGLRI